MEELATRFGENAEEWGMVGLLHDIDYELTKDHPDRHGMEGAKLLVGEGFSESFLSALRSHNNATGHKPANRMEKALYAVDPVSGFIVACALVHHLIHFIPWIFPFFSTVLKKKALLGVPAEIKSAVAPLLI